MNLGESWQAFSNCIAPETGSYLETDSGDGEGWYALGVDQRRSLLLPAHNRRARNSGLRFFLPGK